MSIFYCLSMRYENVEKIRIPCFLWAYVKLCRCVLSLIIQQFQNKFRGLVCNLLCCSWTRIQMENPACVFVWECILWGFMLLTTVCVLALMSLPGSGYRHQHCFETLKFTFSRFLYLLPISLPGQSFFPFLNSGYLCQTLWISLSSLYAFPALLLCRVKTY